MTQGSPGSPSGVIRSTDNRIVKFVRSLRHRSAREMERAFIVEGVRAVDDALAAGATPRLILTRAGDSTAEELVKRSAPEVEVRRVAAEIFERLADTASPQGVLGVFPHPVLPFDLDRSPLVLVLDRLRDPGNVGTLLRSAAAAGATLVAITPQTVDPFNPKVVRAAMGAHFRVPIREWNDDLQCLILRQCPRRVIADAAADLDHDAVDFTEGVALFIGSEAHGVSSEIESLASERARIPLAGNVESLNAAVAGAVLLFEAARQRRRLAAKQQLPT